MIEPKTLEVTSKGKDGQFLDTFLAMVFDKSATRDFQYLIDISGVFFRQMFLLHGPSAR